MALREVVKRSGGVARPATNVREAVNHAQQSPAEPPRTMAAWIMKSERSWTSRSTTGMQLEIRRA